jgi:Arc/MetJ family transcription regulator
MRTVVEIDDEALAGAAAELGTTTKKETINTALRLVASRRERAARVAAATHVFGDPKGLDDLEVQRELTSGRGRRRSR